MGVSEPADGCGMETDGPSGGCFGEIRKKRQQGKKEEKPAGLRIEEEEYAELPGILQSLLIRRCICEMAEAQKDIEAVHMEAVRGLFGRQVGKSRDLPYQLRAVRTYAGVEIRRRSEDRDQKKNQKKAQEEEGTGSRAWN